VIGDALRARRQGQHRTLREVSTAANVSLGYLSEIERGEKEASSELLAAICEALGSQLSEVLRDASDSLARTERPETAPLAPAGSDAADRAKLPAARLPIGDGQVSVSVRRNGPLRTTLHAVRTRPPTRTVVRSS
jgi:transcriptional regulator with XRE-family HTH domain